MVDYDKSCVVMSFEFRSYVSLQFTKCKHQLATYLLNFVVVLGSCPFFFLSSNVMIHYLSLVFSSDASISASNIRRRINLSLFGVFCPNKRY